jgi:hypothetical protein
VAHEYPKLDLMLEQNRQAIRNIRTEFMKMRILEQQERERESVQEQASGDTNLPLPVRKNMMAVNERE